MPDNFPIQQKDRLFSNAIFLNLLLKQPSLLLNGEVIWQAKELHGQTNRQADGKRKRERRDACQSVFVGYWKDRSKIFSDLPLLRATFSLSLFSLSLFRSLSSSIHQLYTTIQLSVAER